MHHVSLCPFLRYLYSLTVCRPCSLFYSFSTIFLAVLTTRSNTNYTVCAKVTLCATMCREDLEWSGGASRAAPCTVGYLAEAEPSLETARCQAAEAHSQQIFDSLTNRDQQGEAKAEGKAKGHKAHIKPELMGAAGSNNAPCTVLVSQC